MNEQFSRLLGAKGDLYPHRTEAKYPRIVEKIAALWGTAGMAPYFNDILFDDRGDREGFPPDVMMELFALSDFHESSKPLRSAIETALQRHEPERQGPAGQG